MAVLRVLHLVGSAVSDFYADLSRLYARECLEATACPDRYQFYIAYISPDGSWRFPDALSNRAIAAAPPLAFPAAVAHLRALHVDVALPQMFCVPGMTRYRALLELLDIPYVGNPPDVMALAAHKVNAKAIVAAAGVNVPDGAVLQRGDQPDIDPPAIVKPVSSDNSLGVTLVERPADFPRALDSAFAYADTVIVERFIELGREVRGGLVIHRGQPVDLPFEEYLLDAQTTPIRSYAEKLRRAETGQLDYAAKGNGKSWIADGNDAIAPAVRAAVRACHAALGCRHYSLFDFRIDPHGQPWFLEAGLYCSFSPHSVLCEMVAAAGTPLPDFFAQLLQQAIASARPSQVADSSVADSPGAG